MAKRREIRNSTAEFLIFQIEGKEQGVEVYYKDKTVWCTQKAMGMLFDCTSDNISVHLQNIYDTDELKKEATTEKISVVRREGNRDVNRKCTAEPTPLCSCYSTAQRTMWDFI